MRPIGFHYDIGNGVDLLLPDGVDHGQGILPIGNITMSSPLRIGQQKGIGDIHIPIGGRAAIEAVAVFCLHPGHQVSAGRAGMGLIKAIETVIGFLGGGIETCHQGGDHHSVALSFRYTNIRPLGSFEPDIFFSLPASPADIVIFPGKVKGLDAIVHFLLTDVVGPDGVIGVGNMLREGPDRRGWITRSRADDGQTVEPAGCRGL